MPKRSNNYSFTIITPAYNVAKYIENNIKAIINSKYDLNKIEHIIVDDGSTDDTYQVVKKYADKFPHIKLYKKPNSNWGGVINYVKKNRLIHNDYVIQNDADDVILPKAFYHINKLSCDEDLIFTNFYKWNGKYGKFLVCPYYYFFKRLALLKRINKKIPPFIWMAHGTFVKKEIYYKMYDLKEHILYQDIITVMQWYQNAKTIRYINHPTEKYYESRPDNCSSHTNEIKNIHTQVENGKILAKNNIPEPLITILIYFKQFRDYCKKHKIVFKFHQKPKFKNVNPLMRIFVNMAYYCSGVNKLIKIVK